MVIGRGMRTALLCALLSAACFSLAPAFAQSRSTAYRCQGGLSVKARFPNATTALVSLEGRTYRLKSTALGPGMKYAGRGLAFHEPFNNASIKLNGVDLPCNRLNPANVGQGFRDEFGR